MAKLEKPQTDSKESSEILRDILITQLGIAGVPPHTIRQIVGCGYERVNRIVKHIKIAKRKEQPE
jgi:hypothetical protein